ncbi:CRISPR-associated CT1975 family protein [Nitrospirillum viridazoti Y2]|uniref:CRISPR-associated Cse4 family protein n=1 Tax=Nitrospirillum amazonense TaxID=28077 RepID=A0A560J1W5_9PROT|nr:type I-E CRISPR-associated protein Cas7/Cse4/CasC [Nitrospirillum amazonense]EGX99508.1 CRISPR-associated CT1975 family protein [Nitrospirillum amazonense Y2]TWB64419.1 CRISPR-associated Cse4 family protein [Nitrospirillum amazonense]
MTAPRFLQIHTLHSYTGALLNRDDSGLAKQLPYGGTIRTRVSSQCLKRHWRTAEDVHALENIAGVEESFRSRELVTIKVIDPLRERFPKDLVDALEGEFQKAVYGDKAEKGKQSRQTLLFGAPELNWLAKEAERLAAASPDAKAAKAAAADWAKAFKENIKALREATALPGGLTAALFGRMVTSDTAANIEAPVHVAHAFTVHAAEAESDYFTAVDDLKREEDDGGADTIQETELTSGLFYGYVVVDLPALIKNCGDDQTLASRVVHNLLYLITEVSPGAKRGSTAPYGRAGFVLVEAGNRQPRSLAAAYRKAVAPDLEAAVAALCDHLGTLDDNYATGEQRRHLSLVSAQPRGSERGSLADLATWSAGRVEEVPL